jgi:hypothetical protein
MFWLLIDSNTEGILIAKYKILSKLINVEGNFHG